VITLESEYWMFVDLSVMLFFIYMCIHTMYDPLWKKNAEKVEYNISKLIKHPCTTKSLMDVNRMCWDRTLYGNTCIWKTTLQTDQHRQIPKVYITVLARIWESRGTLLIDYCLKVKWAVFQLYSGREQVQ
jgi:hypothetical protein